VDQEGAMRCGGAGGARNWRGGAAETADGGGQRSCGEVVERRREHECGCARGASSCWRSTAHVVARAGSGATRLREEEPAGSIKRRTGELGARWRSKCGERGSWRPEKHRRWAVGGAAEKQRGGSRRKKMRTCS
jgi:hypothetical protein